MAPKIFLDGPQCIETCANLTSTPNFVPNNSDTSLPRTRTYRVIREETYIGVLTPDKFSHVRHRVGRHLLKVWAARRVTHDHVLDEFKTARTARRLLLDISDFTVVTPDDRPHVRHQVRWYLLKAWATRHVTHDHVLNEFRTSWTAHRLYLNATIRHTICNKKRCCFWDSRSYCAGNFEG